MVVRARSLSGSLFTTVVWIFGIFMAGISWHRTPDVLFDFGYELYAPWRLLNGEVLYRDIVSHYGPLSFYVHALLFRAFGTDLNVIIVFNLLLIACFTFMVRRFFSTVFSDAAGKLAAAAFLTLFAFSHVRFLGNFNFVTPYAYELTHGLMLSFGALMLAFGARAGGPPGRAAGVGLLAGCAFLTKAEVFLPLAAVLGTLGLVGGRPSARRLAAGLAAFLIPVLLFVCILGRSMSVPEALRAIALPYRLVLDSGASALPFYRKGMGTDAVALNLLKMGVSAGAWAAAALFVMWAARLRRAGRVLCLSAAAIFFIFMPRIAAHFIFYDGFRCLPLCMAGLVALSARRWARSRGAERSRQARILSAALFSLLLLLKMIFNARLLHVGFALAMPATVLSFSFLFEELPERLCGSDPGFARKMLAALLGAVMMFFLYHSLAIYGLKDLRVGSDREFLYDYGPRVNSRGTVMQETLQVLDRTLKKDDTLVVLPEGVIFNYLLRRRSGFPFPYWTATEEAIDGEGRALASLKKADPDFVLLVERDASEHGGRYFGKDYGRRLGAWVRENYVPVARVGEEPFTGRGFGTMVLKRSKGSPHA